METFECIGKSITISLYDFVRDLQMSDFKKT